MPNAIIRMTQPFAVEIWNMIGLMLGESHYKAARAQIQKLILSAWPESDPEYTGESKPKMGETRAIELNPKQQRALAEGFLSVLNNPKCNGLDFDHVQRLAGIGKSDASGPYDGMRVWGWVESHAVQKEVPDFDGVLDGEPPVLDNVKKSTKKK